MNNTTSQTRLWYSSTNMIFWGILTLTIFGWVAAILEFVFGIYSIFFHFVDSFLSTLRQFGHSNNELSEIYTIYDNISVTMRIFEIFTIIGWVLYVVGLSQFKKAQISERGFRYTSSLNTACWLGISSICCYFIGGFVGAFGILFNFTGWILTLVSFFIFRSAFNNLSFEKSWNQKAQSGAGTLCSSYTLAIILMFLPIISTIIILSIIAGAVDNIVLFFKEFNIAGIEALYQHFAGILVVIILFIIISVILWILKTVFLFSGWNKIKNGGLNRKAAVSNQNKYAAETSESEGDLIAFEGETDNHISEEYEDDSTDDEDEDSNRGWIIGGCIAGAIILLIILLRFCSGGQSQQNNDINNDSAAMAGMLFPTAEEESTEQETTDEEMENSYDDTTEPDTEPDGNEYTTHYRGTINNKYEIEMTLRTDGGAYYCGEYFYTSRKTPIGLSGQLNEYTDNLVLDEYNGTDKTGTFEGTLSEYRYSGTWTSADGETTYPFSLTIK